MNAIEPFQFNKDFGLKPIYRDYSVDSIYIKMSDDVEIASEIILPKKLPPKKKIPTILIQTRYWRAYDLRAPFKWLRRDSFDVKLCKIFTRYGFALVVLDVRGTGASFGTTLYPFYRKEINDGKEVIDWIIQQPWSDGNVITWGNSYSGATAELVAIHNHPAVKGIIAKHNPWDLYTHATFPGGCLNNGYLTYWSKLDKGLDHTSGKALLEFKPINLDFALLGYIAVKSVKPVKSDKLKINLKEAAQQHTFNKYPTDYTNLITFRNDIIEDLGINIDDISIFKYKKEIENSNVPMCCWGSWQDSATADIIINRFMTLKNPQIALIGDWDHIAKNRANPFYSPRKKSKPSKANQVKSWIRFCDLCLKNQANSEKTLFYYTMGEERWKKTNKWPPKGQIYQKWYLSENKTLSQEQPQTNNGKDEYEIDFSATTGIRNRWYTLLSLPVKYPNREKQDKKLLTYTSLPIDDNLEITGHPIIKLYMTSTHEDGAVLAYFEFINQKGKIHYITDGQLRFIHRKISSDTPPYHLIGPYHSFKKEDYSPLKPGNITETTFALYPTSLLLPKGSRIRIAIGGADKDSFARYPEEGNPMISIARNKNYASYLEIPIIKNSIN